MRPDETRKAERACKKYDIRSELLDMSWSILQDRDVPCTCSCESFEDRSGEGVHVNSRLSHFLFCVCGNWSVPSMRCCGPEDWWFVFENHAEWKICLFAVPRQALVERASSLLWSAVLRAVARLCARRALSFLQFPVVSCISVNV